MNVMTGSRREKSSRVFQTLTGNFQSAPCSVHCQAAHRPSLASPALTPGSGNLPNLGIAALRRGARFI